MKISPTVLAFAIASTDAGKGREKHIAKLAKLETSNSQKGNDRPRALEDCYLAFQKGKEVFGSELTFDVDVMTDAEWEQWNNKAGWIDIHNYPNDLNCQINIMANKECGSINVNVVHAGFEQCNYEDQCNCDSFRFKDINGQKTEKMCGCIGGGVFDGSNNNSTYDFETGCSDILYPGSDAEHYHYSDYIAMYDYGYEEGAYINNQLSFPGREFTLELITDPSWAHGNLRVEWECVDAPKTCTDVYSNMDQLQAAIEDAISTGLENDILTVSQNQD